MIVTNDADPRAKVAVIPIVIGAALSEEERWLEHYLALWAIWMRSKEDLPEACPSEASGGLTPYTSWDSEGMCERMDAEHAQQTHYVISTALTETERNVIYHAYGLMPVLEVWRYNAVLAEAREKVKRELLRAGLWFGQ